MNEDDILEELEERNADELGWKSECETLKRQFRIICSDVIYDIIRDQITCQYGERPMPTLQSVKREMWREHIRISLSNFYKRFTNGSQEDFQKALQEELAAQTRAVKRDNKRREAAFQRKWEEVKQRKMAYQSGKAEEVEFICSENLKSNDRDLEELFDYQPEFQLRFLPENGQLQIEYQLPGIKSIRDIKEWKQEKNGQLRQVKLAAKEMENRYKTIISDIALRTIAIVLESDHFSHIKTVEFQGIVKALDKRYGRWCNILVLTVAVPRNEYEKVDLNHPRQDSYAFLAECEGFAISKGLTGEVPKRLDEKNVLFS